MLHKDEIFIKGIHMLTNIVSMIIIISDTIGGLSVQCIDLHNPLWGGIIFYSQITPKESKVDRSQTTVSGPGADNRKELESSSVKTQSLHLPKPLHVLLSFTLR